jgi:hypothetical protein
MHLTYRDKVDESSTWWWLRSPNSNNDNNAGNVNTSGNINNNNVNNDNNGVSPDSPEEPETVSKQGRSERFDIGSMTCLRSCVRAKELYSFSFMKWMEKHMLSGKWTPMLSQSSVPCA